MRFIVKAEICTERGNAAFKDGSFSGTMQSILEDLKPESAYFYEETGQRTALLVLNMNDASEIPRIAEPFYLAFNARVYFHPLMTAEDLGKAGPAIQSAVERYGH